MKLTTETHEFRAVTGVGLRLAQTPELGSIYVCSVTDGGNTVQRFNNVRYGTVRYRYWHTLNNPSLRFFTGSTVPVLLPGKDVLSSCERVVIPAFSAIPPFF